MAATPSGTRAYFDRLKKNGISVSHSSLGATELQASRIGFGSYRVHEFEPEHSEALRLALLGGCNLVDTSSNYTDGSSERLIGNVLADLFEKGQLKREEVIIVTKAGYVQGENLQEAKKRAERGQPFPDMVEFQPDCWHNLSPEFLEAQITNSLERLKVQELDFLLLHNPECYLKTSGGTREAYYQRIEKAFRHLETERFKGRIKYYGISSNTFPEDAARSDFTNLQRVLDIAQTVAKPNHFALIEFPFNLFESGGALTKNNQQETVFDLAAKSKIAILTNRPFNSFNRGRLLRLTSFPLHDEVEVKGGLHVTLGRAIELEKSAPGYPKAAQGLQWAHSLRERLGDLDDLLAWRDVLYQQIFPSIRQALGRLTPERAAWSATYQNTMQELLKLITWDLENLANQKAKLIEEQLVQHAPEFAEDKELPPTSLSRKILRLYKSFPQINSVLVGMRSTAYVKDALQADAPLSTARAQEVLSRFLKHRS